jgi:hypothetical protein
MYEVINLSTKIVVIRFLKLSSARAWVIENSIDGARLYDIVHSTDRSKSLYRDIHIPE